MKFDLDEEQTEMRDTVRRFTEQEIVPHAEAWDENNHFPREIYHQMAQLGLMGMTTPEEYGGRPLSRPPPALIYQEIGRGERAKAGCRSAQKMSTRSIPSIVTHRPHKQWGKRLAHR